MLASDPQAYLHWRRYTLLKRFEKIHDQRVIQDRFMKWYSLYLYLDRLNWKRIVRSDSYFKYKQLFVFFNKWIKQLQHKRSLNAMDLQAQELYRKSVLKASLIGLKRRFAKRQLLREQCRQIQDNHSKRLLNKLLDWKSVYQTRQMRNVMCLQAMDWARARDLRYFSQWLSKTRTRIKQHKQQSLCVAFDRRRLLRVSFYHLKAKHDQIQWDTCQIHSFKHKRVCRMMTKWKKRTDKSLMHNSQMDQALLHNTHALLSQSIQKWLLRTRLVLDHHSKVNLLQTRLIARVQKHFIDQLLSLLALQKQARHFYQSKILRSMTRQWISKYERLQVKRQQDRLLPAVLFNNKRLIRQSLTSWMRSWNNNKTRSQQHEIALKASKKYILRSSFLHWMHRQSLNQTFSVRLQKFLFLSKKRQHRYYLYQWHSRVLKQQRLSHLLKHALENRAVQQKQMCIQKIQSLIKRTRKLNKRHYEFQLMSMESKAKEYLRRWRLKLYLVQKQDLMDRLCQRFQKQQLKSICLKWHQVLCLILEDDHSATRQRAIHVD